MTTQTQATPIAVLGAGSWGTALALQMARNGNVVRLWGHDPDHMQRLVRDRHNREFLPDGPQFPALLTPVVDFHQAIEGAGDLLVVVPSHAFREVLSALPAGFSRLAWATKGLEPGTGALLHQVATEVLGAQARLAVVSGPSFAREVASGLPTAVTVAANDAQFAADIANRLHGQAFRVYTSDDLVGVQLGGAVKNVLAVAAGIADGLGFAANARSALITRGLHEIMRLGKALGARPETLMGLAGLGDLILTCTDDQSRNRRFGLALGRGKTQAQALAEIGQVVEGVSAAQETMRLAHKFGVEMPIAEQTSRILFDGLDPRSAVQALLEREQTSEH